MHRRTLLQWVGAATAALPFRQVRLWAQPRELTAESIATLHEIAPTILPQSIGADRLRDIVDKFVVWTKGYREGVATAHGYGHPRLQKTGPSPVPRYNEQLAQLRKEIANPRAHLDAAFTQAGVRNLPPRPTGQHVVADLMAFYFRSSEANDVCYSAMIQREVCRPIAITIRKPEPLR